MAWSLLGNMLTMPFQFLWDYHMDKGNKKHQTQINESNIEHAWDINQANIAMQRETNLLNQSMLRETNAQQLQLQHEAWNREDNAVQRRMTDLRSAGMNPVLAAGQGAQASGPINLNVPRDDAPHARHMARMEAYRMRTDLAERMLRMRDDFATNAAVRRNLESMNQEHSARADQIRRETDLLGSSEDSFGLRIRQAVSTMEREGAQSALLEAQQETERLRQSNIEAQTMSTLLENVRREVENEVAKRTAEDRISQVEEELISITIANEIARREEDIRADLGVTQSGSLVEKGVQFVRHQANRFLDWAVGTFAPDFERESFWKLRRRAQ